MKRWLAVAAVTPVLVWASACGDSQKEPYVVRADATEFAFEMPDEIKAGLVTFDFTNSGQQYHEFALAKIEEGKTLEEIEAAFASEEPPPWATDIGALPIVDSGRGERMTRNMEPGTYVFLCFMPDTDGTPHVMRGMSKLFKAVGTVEGEAPDADGAIVATDEAFEMPSIGGGEQTLELKNTGSAPHEFTIVAFDEGKTMDDVGGWFATGMQGDAPADFVGGMQTVQPGESVWVTLELESGRTYTVIDSDTGVTGQFTVS